MAGTLCGDLAKGGTAWGRPTTLQRREPALALWCFGKHQGFRLQKLVPAAITLILQRFTIH